MTNWASSRTKRLPLRTGWRVGRGVLLGLAGPAMLLALPAIAAGSPPSATLRRDIEGYAFAACLVAQDVSYLKDQGHGWGAVVLERSRGGFEPLRALAETVEAEAARRPMAMMHEDGPVSAPSVPLPILFCAELLETPVVRAAKRRAMQRLAPAYRR